MPKNAVKTSVQVIWIGIFFDTCTSSFYESAIGKRFKSLLELKYPTTNMTFFFTKPLWCHFQPTYGSAFKQLQLTFGVQKKLTSEDFIYESYTQFRTENRQEFVFIIKRYTIQNFILNGQYCKSFCRYIKYVVFTLSLTTI